MSTERRWHRPAAGIGLSPVRTGRELDHLGNLPVYHTTEQGVIEIVSDGTQTRVVVER